MHSKKSEIDWFSESICDMDFSFWGFLSWFDSKENKEAFIHMLLWLHPNFYVDTNIWVPKPSFFEIYFQNTSLEAISTNTNMQDGIQCFELKGNLFSRSDQVRILKKLDTDGKVYLKYNKIHGKKPSVFLLQVKGQNNVKSRVEWIIK